MGELSGFRYREIIKRLKTLGFQFSRQAAGSHEIWFSPALNRYTTIPDHPGDMPEGTLKAILKQAGVEPEAFSASSIRACIEIRGLPSADGGTTEAGPGGGVAPGLRTEPGADGTGHRPLGGLDLSPAQPFSRRKNCGRRAATGARWAAAPAHECHARTRGLGAIPGPSAQRRHPRGQSGQSRTGSSSGPPHGAGHRLQPAAPARLAQTRPR